MHVQEEIIPCVCDGRYDGMEEIVSWIACDACEAWFHGEWVAIRNLDDQCEI